MVENTKYLKQFAFSGSLIVYLVVANLNYQRYITYGYILYGTEFCLWWCLFLG